MTLSPTPSNQEGPTTGPPLLPEGWSVMLTTPHLLPNPKILLGSRNGKASHENTTTSSELRAIRNGTSPRNQRSQYPRPIPHHNNSQTLSQGLMAMRQLQEMQMVASKLNKTGVCWGYVA